MLGSDVSVVPALTLDVSVVLPEDDVGAPGREVLDRQGQPRHA